MRWDSVLLKNVPTDTKKLTFAKQLVKNSPVDRTRKRTRTSDKTLTRPGFFLSCFRGWALWFFVFPFSAGKSLVSWQTVFSLLSRQSLIYSWAPPSILRRGGLTFLLGILAAGQHLPGGSGSRLLAKLGCPTRTPGLASPVDCGAGNKWGGLSLNHCTRPSQLPRPVLISKSPRFSTLICVFLCEVWVLQTAYN